MSEREKVKRRDSPPERIDTAQMRQLPNFVSIGTQRGGTTSLYRYLREHAGVGPALRKEVHYFYRCYEKGIDWYLANFPLRGEAPVVGEASPYYLFHLTAPERAREVIPHAKLSALLGNPVDRAYSRYQMVVRRGIEKLSFEDAIERERERLSGDDDPVSIARQYYSYIRRGPYVEQVQHWMSIFPRRKFLMIKSEDFYKDPEQTPTPNANIPWAPTLEPREARGLPLERIRRAGPRHTRAPERIFRTLQSATLRPSGPRLGSGE